MIRLSVFVVLLVVALLNDHYREVQGHGMVLAPVNRASRWRQDSSAPVDYNDNGLYCGGFYVQHSLNGGKCGYCGDDYRLSTPRPHEHGGTYGKGKIVNTYQQGGLMPVSVLLTANHQGYFYFNLCKMDGAAESDSCFAKYPLSTSYGSTKHYLGSTATGYYNLTLKLPSDVYCGHCVLQWTYNVGNSWGVCEDGTGKLGCGAQENFRTCSDIAITRQYW